MLVGRQGAGCRGRGAERGTGIGSVEGRVHHEEKQGKRVISA